MISIIAAMTKDRVMGSDLELPWYIPEDWAHFKATTLHKPIIMGRKTFDSIKRKPLPNRANIIISNTLEPGIGYQVAKSSTIALEMAQKYASDEIMIIGGAQIYKEFLPITDKMYLSIIHKDYHGNVFFPQYDINLWTVLSITEKKEFTIKILQKKLPMDDI